MTDDGAPFADEESKAIICGFCRERTLIGFIPRLKVSDETASGYEEIQVPYCGFC